MKKYIIFTLLVLIGLITTNLLTACNTMRGLGQDVSKGGQAIERAADRPSQK